jgi:hypothetical protein
MSGHPYRISDGPPLRFVCVACYRTGSTEAGTCSRCGSPRAPLDSDQVREDVRAHAERVQQRAAARRVTAELVGFSLLACVLYALLGVAGVVDFHQPHHFRHLPINELVFIPLWLACVFGGALVIELRARRRRVSTDPLALRMPELLQFLGVRIE